MVEDIRHMPWFATSFESSEEAPGINGLGLLKGKVKKLNLHIGSSKSKMHLGWSRN